MHLDSRYSSVALDMLPLTLMVMVSTTQPSVCAGLIQAFDSSCQRGSSGQRLRKWLLLFQSLFSALIVVQLGFLENLVKVFPSLATRPFYLTGESYAGRYIVSLNASMEWNSEKRH